MSLVVELSVIRNQDITGVSAGLAKVAKKLAAITGGAGSEELINSTICRGILQNDINIGFSNAWDSTVYQGLMKGVENVSKTNINIKAPGLGAGVSLNFVKGLYDFGQTAMNMGGVSMIGTGASSTRVYGGSSMSGFNVEMKWYTPMDKSYQTSIPALMVLAFPTQRTSPPPKGQEGGIHKALEKVPGVGGLINSVLGTLPTLISYNPPIVRLNVLSGSDKVFAIHPLVITNLTFNFSRETCDGVPVVITANISFEFYQIYGNNGYANDPFKLAGVDVLGNINKIGKK